MMSKVSPVENESEEVLYDGLIVPAYIHHTALRESGGDPVSDPTAIIKKTMETYVNASSYMTLGEDDVIGECLAQLSVPITPTVTAMVTQTVNELADVVESVSKSDYLLPFVDAHDDSSSMVSCDNNVLQYRLRVVEDFPF